MKPFPVLRTCVLRPAAFSRTSNAIVGVKRPAARHFADDKSRNLYPAAPGQTGPNVSPQDHVSEEAAKIAKAQGMEGPDLSQGTPIQEILKDDKEARKQAPEAVKDSIKAGAHPTPSTDPQSTGPKSTDPSGKRSFSTYARRRAEMDLTSSESQQPLDPSMIPSAPPSAALDTSMAPTSETKPGHKFPLPDLPLPRNVHKDRRADPICEQMVGLLMRDGKKSVAEKNLNIILNTLRTSSVPTYSPTRPMIPGAPPASHLPLHPILYLTLAIDSVAPLLRIRSQRGAAGGGAALQIPTPLTLHQRRRTAIMWMIDAASKRKSSGSGDGQFAMRVAQEVISVVEGRSAIWDRRNGIHRLGTAARVNVNYFGARRR